MCLVCFPVAARFFLSLYRLFYRRRAIFSPNVRPFFPAHSTWESSINKGINYGIPSGMLFALTAVRQAIDEMPENKSIINTFIY
jgi:hypothetical protein